MKYYKEHYPFPKDDQIRIWKKQGIKTWVYIPKKKNWFSVRSMMDNSWNSGRLNIFLTEPNYTDSTFKEITKCEAFIEIL